MKIIISPTKTMKEGSSNNLTTPLFIDKAIEIRKYLKSLDKNTLASIWKCNDKLVNENIERLNNNLLEPTGSAITMYDGLQFKYMDYDDLNSSAKEYINSNLRIISAHYGLLKPTDGIVSYRLDYLAKIDFNGHKNLYSYWNNLIYNELAKDEDTIINLCSKEYSDAIIKYLEPKIKFINIIFAEIKGGTMKVKSTDSKMNRGLMVQYMANNNIKRIEDIKNYNLSEYKYNENYSDELNYYFTKC